MESKWQRKRREYDAQLRTDDELPKVAAVEQPVSQPKEVTKEREVRTDAE